MRLKLALFCTAQGSVSRVPHSWGWIVTVVEVDETLGERRLWSRLNLMAPDKAGEEGWSVAVTVEAWARAQTTDGSAAPGDMLAFVFGNNLRALVDRIRGVLTSA